MAFNVKKMFGKDSVDEYVEIDLNQDAEKKEKIKVRPFVLKSYDDINEILDTLREGYTIAIIDIKYLKSKDVIELKRSVTKIKKTIEALEGSIAGFGEHTIIATPDFAEVYTAPAKTEQKKDFGF
jgi:SepF-like predicted cell division protein (DUF552 family)|tara:strand:+ start:975 stop:1349 length:375 start_codon:yes stop_codon:yes gene_type:complete